MFWMQDVPFKPGASPFRCKGVLYQDSFVYFDEHFKGGRGSILRHVEGPGFSSFLSQQFIIGGWYDVFPLLALHSLAARITGTGFLELERDIAQFQVPRQFNGIHRFLLKLTTPDVMMANLPRLGDKYFDFVRIESKRVREKTYESFTSGVPALAAASYLTVSDVAIRAALEMAGAQGVRIQRHPLEPAGEAHGLPIVLLKRVVRWT
ncbi:hypothetical protein [Chondromyces apiculatus]|uniref:Uncharacterized protein n=1 Tax=Chondromyces apiculatus DSM 436 TaxID=1192034 RepID=A0A017T6W0_9BACT|nr:hypothetical protein [Chondromyces apiculatus]EYF04752.1 Hypothetical protein CAP_4228 [Chondromyces apiculatus DSM 436]